MEMNAGIIAALVTVASGSLFYVFVYPYLSGDVKAERRRAALQSKSSKSRVDPRVQDAEGRRKKVADSLKDIEARNKSKKITLETRMSQAGLNWSRTKYFVISGFCGLGALCLAFFVSGNLWVMGAAVIIGGLGIPTWLVSHLRKKRMKKFLHEFPGAIDVIVRGVKAGLPLLDCLRIVANEVAEPVKSEFRQIVESQAIGLSLPEAVSRLPERVPTSEANFFAIVITIQQKSGGNLSEALGNLSAVLRDRKLMKGKVAAMSSEAKASAGIIGVLPFIVTLLVYLSSPQYIELLWTTSTGQFVLGCAATWMSIGIFTIKKMVNFDM
jgi:tight adherence protein B